MDDNLPKSNTTVGDVAQLPQDQNISSELAHVTQEMYKKNAELALTNKTLSILQKINTIILSSVTDLSQVAKEVVDVIVAEAEFRRVNIYIAKKEDGLVRLAGSDGEIVERAEHLAKKQFPSEKIMLDHEDNLFVKAYKTSKLQVSNNYLDILTPDFTPEIAAIIQQTLNVKSIFVYPLVVRDQAIGIISFSLVEEADKIPPYEQDLINRLVGIIGVAVDSSLLYQNIQEANVKLEGLDKLKDEFVSLASHELRTPMTVIKSYTWMLIEGKAGGINDKQKEYLSRTYSSVERLINMVNDMLNISRIESGRFTIEPVLGDLVKLIDEVTVEMQQKAQELGITITFENPPAPLMAMIDQGRIKEVIINLIGNSIKFTPNGGAITISTFINNGFITVSIKDTGRGISAEDMKKLFQKFNMVGGTSLTKDRGQGSGLGLYLSKSLVELHGGKIWASSEGEGKGTTFSFTIPEVKHAA